MREKLIIKGSPHKQGNNFEIFGDNETGEIIIRSGAEKGFGDLRLNLSYDGTKLTAYISESELSKMRKTNFFGKTWQVFTFFK